MNHPLVSVIIPVYNGADYMREAIDSALAQTYDNTEVIVVNDGSDDGGKTREIALSYGDQIRYLEKENGGVSSALNYGIRNMKGDYFSWLSHDDAYTPDKIASQIAALEKCADDKVVTYCRCSVIDSKSRPVNRKSKSDVLPTERLIPYEDVLKHLFKHGSMNGCCFLIDRRIFDECGLFDETLRYAQDVLMWYRIFLCGYKLYVLPNKSVMSRVHANQLTQTGRSRYLSDSLEICRMVLPQFAEASVKENNFVFLYAMHHAMRGNSAVVDLCRAMLKEIGLYNPILGLRLRIMQFYGTLRPSIRQLYYRLFRKIKTE